MFKAIVVDKVDGQHRATYEHWREEQLPDKPVLVEVAYSSLNFKDGLAVTGKGKILRSYPMIPGIDLAGTVIDSDTSEFKVGDAVVLTGAGLGEDYCGGYAQKARVDTEALIKLPTAFRPQDAMAVGTAGFTAMLAVAALQKAGITPDQGPIVVSGAAGGVGSIAIAILARMGYSVTAVTGREELHQYLRELGASDIISREQMPQSARPLESQKWAGAVDNVGGQILAKIIAETKGNGAIASCGLAASHELHTTVMPFILRAIKLLGINSTLVTKEHRLNMWQQLSELFETTFWEKISKTIRFSQIPEYAEKITKGEIRGRVIVDINAE
ncbi:MAG: oxidoreductase [Pseudomonadales bacterium]|nr:oxidoreductase [Pseudomonadales bacterium]